MREPYCVSVVVDKAFGERLLQLAETGPVWIVDTPPNKEAARKVWAAHQGESHLTGVTTFDACASSEADTLINELDTIDLHHGVYSANPPYTVLEVIGTPLTERVKTELAEFGFNEFESKPNGFRAVRPLPDNGAAG